MRYNVAFNNSVACHVERLVHSHEIRLIRLHCGLPQSTGTGTRGRARIMKTMIMMMMMMKNIEGRTMSLGPTVKMMALL